MLPRRNSVIGFSPMPIDDLPSSRALERLKSEQRQQTPDVVRKAAIAVSKLFAGDFGAAVESFGEFHDAIADERSEYLMRWIIADLRAQDLKYEELSARLQEYLTTDWIGLLADADRKARETRAKERIRRIALILVGSVREPIPAPDETEEAMRIAMELTDEDVAALRSVLEAQEKYENQPAPFLGVLKPPLVPELGPNRALSSFGKLQGLGLIIRAQDRAEQLGGVTHPSGGGFFMLERGQNFLRSIAVQATPGHVA
jgi:hypothetical protein